MGLSQYRLAKEIGWCSKTGLVPIFAKLIQRVKKFSSTFRTLPEIGVPAQRISEIVAGKRGITADTDLRLCRFFGMSNGY
ncbi:HTH domain-containing protein [Desulfonema magnum]|uniref:HTH domain-containing protein n=1 Tax=Desulfonema magnum TaxID=45655 RepID=A0A975BJK6_9BACT|nr:HTH domain-containing protein [Desulfonema magnum]